MALTRLTGRSLRPTALSSPLRRIHSGPDTIDELLDRHLSKPSPKHQPDEPTADRQRLTGARREALSLYRDVIRASRFYTWRDASGQLWRDVLRENARREFELAREERDPEVVTRLLIGGREAVGKAVEKLVEAARKGVEKEEAERRKGGR